jgi:hypothetical protein
VRGGGYEIITFLSYQMKWVCRFLNSTSAPNTELYRLYDTVRVVIGSTKRVVSGNDEPAAAAAPISRATARPRRESASSGVVSDQGAESVGEDQLPRRRIDDRATRGHAHEAERVLLRSGLLADEHPLRLAVRPEDRHMDA